MARRKREHVRTSAADSCHMNRVKMEFVEEFSCIVRDDRDSATRKSARRAVTGSVEDNQPCVESVIDALVSVA
jgi:hypothetical protein